MEIFTPVIALGALGLIFGALLGVAARKLKIEVDEKTDKICELLPGANCGGCGFAGCNAFAKALTDNSADASLCSGCSEENLNKIENITGGITKKREKLVAYVMCSGKTDICKDRFTYEGIKDCNSALRYANGAKACLYACLGYGTCVESCKFNALSIKDGLAIVDSSLCVGCGACIDVCPRGVIKLIPKKKTSIVLCSSKNKGAKMKNICTAGCIGCSICVKECKEGAITVDNNLAVIDYNKCTACGDCVLKCPKNIITLTD